MSNATTSRRIITIPYTVGEHFASYISYGEIDHLEKVEVDAFNEMETEARENGAPNYEFAHWVIQNGYEEFAKCEATGFFGTCITIEAVYYHKDA